MQSLLASLYGLNEIMHPKVTNQIRKEKEKNTN